jgi:hypothetical protein
MADLLVPGVTTVTPHARYYALHGLTASAAAARNLDPKATNRLRRRAEVLLALISSVHSHDETGRRLPKAHGADALAGRLQGTYIDLEEAARFGSGGYVMSEQGFLNPYRASEIDLHILTADATPSPGPAYDDPAVRAGLGDILELADQHELEVAQLSGFGHLCICAGGGVSDGAWLARLLYGTADLDPRSRPAARRQTIRLFARVLETHVVGRPAADAALALAFGDFATTDAIASQLPIAEAWRGALLRNYSVGAWRRIWSWLVSTVVGETPAVAVADNFADAVPDQTIEEFLDDLPDTQLPSGSPAPAEEVLRSSERTLPWRELSVLAAGARRVDELSGRTRDSFLGARAAVDLAPEWMARRLGASRQQPLRDFVRDLTADLLTRARRIAMLKARRRLDGTIWLPTRLHERGDMLYKTSNEGGGDAGLRLEQLTTVLAGAGVIGYADRHWRVTSAGEALVRD